MSSLTSVFCCQSLAYDNGKLETEIPGVDNHITEDLSALLM